MSSFSTNSNTRRTKRARVHNVRPDASSAVVGSSINKSFEHNSALNVSGKRVSLVDTHIGSCNSKGLVIVGGSAHKDFHHPENPDNRGIPGGTSGDTNGLRDTFPNSTLAHPPHPISFTGPGYLAFQQEVALPTIRGDCHVTGDVIIDGTLTVVNEGVATSFTPVITDALGNELDGVTMVSSTYVTQTIIDYFVTEISWTGFFQLAAGELIRLTGLPLSSYALGAVPIMQGQGGIATSAVGGNYHVQVVSGQSYLLLEEVDVTGGTAPTGLTDANFFGGAGSLHVSGWLRKI